MSKRLSKYSFDELLLMPRKQLEELLQRAIDTILRTLDPDGDIVKELKENR